jgi:hypothetical protein
MAGTTQHGMADAWTLWTSAFLEAPLAGAQWGLGLTNKQKVMGTMWKGYDAWVRLTNTTINEMYKNSFFGTSVATSLDHALRWQRLGQAWVSSASASLWPTLGLPTAATVETVQEEVQSLTSHLRAQDAHIQALRAEIHLLLADRPPYQEKYIPKVGLEPHLRTTPAKLNGHRTHRTMTVPVPSA